MDDTRKALPEGGDEHEQPMVFKVAGPGSRRAVLETVTKGALVAAVAASCGKGNDNPAAPATSTTTAAIAAYTLFGTVQGTRGEVIPGARLTVLDGPNANRTVTTDGNGYYSMANLARSGFTVRCSADRYDSVNRPCTLTSDYRMDFTLPLRPTTSTSRTSRHTTTRCSCNSQCSCNPVHCGCNPLIYWYPN